MLFLGKRVISESDIIISLIAKLDTLQLLIHSLLLFGNEIEEKHQVAAVEEDELNQQKS